MIIDNFENKYYDILFDEKKNKYVPLERKYMIDPNNLNNQIIHTIHGLRVVCIDTEKWDTLGHLGKGLSEYQMKLAKERYNLLGFIVFEYKKYCQEFCDWLNNL